MSSFLQHWSQFLSTPGKLIAHVCDTVLPSPGRKRARELAGDEAAEQAAPPRTRSRLSGAEEPAAPGPRAVADEGAPRGEPEGGEPERGEPAPRRACQPHTGFRGSSLRQRGGGLGVQAAYLRGLYQPPLAGGSAGDPGADAAARRSAALFPHPLLRHAAAQPGSSAPRAPGALTSALPGEAGPRAAPRYHGPQGGFQALQRSPLAWPRRAPAHRAAPAATPKVLVQSC